MIIYMNKKIVITCLSILLASWGYAQDEMAIVDDSVKSDAFDMPEGMLISEEELMRESSNINNLSEGAGASRVLSYDDSVLVSRLSRIPTTIEMPLNDVTRKFIDTYSTRMKGSVAIMLGSSNFYNPIFEEALERYGLPLELKYLPVIESALRPSATSRAGAAGLWQFMIGTGKRYGLEVNTLVDERRDPIKSSEAAAHYLSDLYEMFGDWGLAIAAYNCGEGNVQKAITRSGSQEGTDFWSIYNRLPRETRGYVPAFIAATYIMNYYCEHNICPMETQLPEKSDTVMVCQDVHLEQIASVLGIDLNQLKELNPQYRQNVVNGYTQPSAIRLPQNYIGKFIDNENAIFQYDNDRYFTKRSEVEIGGSKRTAPVYRNGVVMVNNQDMRVGAKQNPTAQRSTPSQQPSASKTANDETTIRVCNGQTLYSIAASHGVTVEQIKRLNNLKSNSIVVGEQLRLK